jgi:hypothetical protein
MSEQENDGRMGYKDAVQAVRSGKVKAAFIAMPVFGERTDDEAQTAEGARIFLLEPDGEGDAQIRFIAGPFFSAAYAANEVLDLEEVPDSVKELRFLPTRCEDDWLSDQLQVLIQKLAQASGAIENHIPDYANTPEPSADSDAVFPVHFIGKPE